jgi:hypothetical protein
MTNIRGHVTGLNSEGVSTFNENENGSFKMTDNETHDVKSDERPVLVTTEYRGVFFGYTDDSSGDTIHLKNCRNCIYWPSAQGGFLGLASKGPVEGSRIGARVSRFEARKVTSVTECTPEAVAAWENADVYTG